MKEIPDGAEIAESDYFRDIEAEFIRLRGTPFLLSPLDFAAVRRWQDLGVPLSDVLDGMRLAFSRRQEGGSIGRINSVRYCEGAVLESWERNAASRVGRPRDASVPAAETPEEALLGLDAELSELSANRPEIAGEIDRARSSLARLRRSARRAEEMDAALSRIEKRLLKASAEALSEEERSRLDTAVETLLQDAGADRMSAAAAARTREILRRQRLRQRWGVPRLTLLGR
jgi:chromosome segregation ATPase